MSEQFNAVNYTNKIFGEACQELEMNPQTLMGLLLFKFLQIDPSERVMMIAELKKEFNEFSLEADFKVVDATVKNALDVAELKLHNWLLNAQDESTGERSGV